MRFFKKKNENPNNGYKMQAMEGLYNYLSQNILSSCKDKSFFENLESRLKVIDLRTRPLMTEVYAQHLYINDLVDFDVWLDIDYILCSLDYIPNLQIQMLTPTYMSRAGIIDVNDPIILQNRKDVINAKRCQHIYTHRNDFIIIAQIPFFSLGGGDGFRIIDGNHRFCEAMDEDSPLKAVVILAPYLLPFFCGDSHELFELLNECAVKIGLDSLFIDYNLPSR